MTDVGRAPRRRASFRRRLLTVTTAYAVCAALLIFALLAVHGHMRTKLEQATDEFVAEQWIADEIATTVMRQVLAASTYGQTPDSSLMAEFGEAGDEANRLIRQYLFRDLTADQRMQLEMVKEHHQKLEVAAARSLDLAGRGRDVAAAAAARDMAAHGLGLQRATASFLAMREADLDRLRATQSTTFGLLSFAGGVFGLLIVGGAALWGRYLYRRLAEPLGELSTAAVRIGEGDLDARVPVPEEDELAAVARSFNEMTDRLGAAHRDLETRNRELGKALDELHATQAELIQTEKLGALGGMLAGFAHELNNPLAAVLGYGQLLDQRLEANEDIAAGELREEYLAPIVSEASRARSLIQNLLRFSRKSSAEVEAVPLAEAVEVVEGLRSYALQQEGVELLIDPPPDILVAAEPQRLQQALLTVINNAFDALMEQGTESHDGPDRAIRVRFDTGDDRVAVIIEDDGPGFADPGRVFEPFYTTKPVGQGTGIGLTLLHRFMEEVGGTARAENRPDGGARVVLTFRKAAADEPSAHGEPRSFESGSETAPHPARGLRVLVVEDEAPLRKLQDRLLDRIGAAVTVAEGGNEARRILESNDFDIVVSDVKMPDGSGLELYRWIEAERPALIDRVLFVTGDIGDPRLGTLAAERPELFLDKPFHTDQYLDRIARLATLASPPA